MDRVETKSYKRNYTGQWALLFLLAAGIIFWQRSIQRADLPVWKPVPVSTPAVSNVNWFFIIKMPEISTQYESGVDTMKIRMTEWLTTLKDAGFHPMRMSDVLDRLQKNEGVPENTVVTLFNPGYRRTYEIVNPIFSKLHWPVLWLTDDKGMQASDRRLVTYHTARGMKTSGLYDIGSDLGKGQFQLEGFTHLSWASASGAFALNHAGVLKGMNFLSVNSAWLAPELLNRLRVETPPTGNAMVLGKGMIQGREWGLTLPGGTSGAHPLFDLRAPLNRRGTKLFFLGTQGITNFKLHVESAHLVGEFWTQLNVDDVSGDEINIIYADKGILVVQQMIQAKQQLFFGPNPVPSIGRGFTEDLTLQGTQLTVSINGGHPLNVTGLKPALPGRGLLQVYIADKPHGTARADAVSMIFTPLSPEGHPAAPARP